MDKYENFPVQSIGKYEIRLAGVLAAEYQAWFDGFQLIQCNGETVLVGPIQDQAALHGLLRRVRDLGIPLLSVKCIDESTKPE